MKKKLIIIASIVIVVAAVLILTHLPKDIEQTMTVSTADGTTAEVVFDLRYYPNLILPSIVRGTVTFDGVEYTDKYTMLDSLPGQIENHLFKFNWDFVRSDCTDFMAMQINTLKVFDFELDKEFSKVICSVMDESKPNGTGGHSGVNYWGPAQNAEEAKKVAESLGFMVHPHSPTFPSRIPVRSYPRTEEYIPLFRDIDNRRFSIR